MELLLIAMIASFMLVGFSAVLVAVLFPKEKEQVVNITISNVGNKGGDNMIERLIDEAVTEALEDNMILGLEVNEEKVRACAEELKAYMMNDDEYSDYNICELKDVIEISIHNIIKETRR